MRLWTVVTHHLAEGHLLQAFNHPRPHPQGEEQRGQQADNGSERQVGKDVEAGIIFDQMFGQPN
ncbi:hypothetical protein D3C78_1202820 [compost metagenome]